MKLSVLPRLDLLELYDHEYGTEELHMELGLTGKVALISGASRGIGAASARALGACGATVIVNYLQSEDKARSVLQEIEDSGGKGMICQADVREPESVMLMVDKAKQQFGAIDILVNNANIDFPMKPFTDLAWHEFEAKISGELKSLYNCSQAVLPDMMTKKSGKLICISSTLSRQPGFGFSAHAAAKSAMDSLARVMAMELGPMGITVNTIGPGLTETDATAGIPRDMREQIAAHTPLKRIGFPVDVAGVVVFLASSLSDYLSGQYIPVSGGGLML